MVHRTHRPDANRDQIVKAMEAKGWTVFNTGMVGEGFSDLVIAKPYHPDMPSNWEVFMVEIKNGNAPYTPKEQKFQDEHPGLVITVRSVEDVERLF